MTMPDYKTPPHGDRPDELTRGIDWADLAGKLGPFIGLVFVFLLFTIITEVVRGASPFANFGNLELIVRLSAVVGTAALGMTMVIISGGIDLSVGSTIALTTIVIAMLLERHVPATAAAAGGVLAAAACGLLIGVLVTQLKLSPFIVTLGLWGAIRGVALGLSGEANIYPPNTWRFTWLHGLLGTVPASRAWMVFPAGVWLTAALAVLMFVTLRYTRFGRHVFAIGSNEQTARLCGVPVNRTKLLIYLISSAFAGMAGVLEFSYISKGDPSTSTGAELDVIAAVVIGGASLTGGQGSVLGTLIGALIMTMVASGCNKLPHVEDWLQKIATGVIIILACALDRLRHRRAA